MSEDQLLYRYRGADPMPPDNVAVRSMPLTSCPIAGNPDGLALCRIHHGAYDVGILGVDPEYRVRLSRHVLEEHDGPMLRHELQEMHGGLVQVPRPAQHLPRRGYLAERFAQFLAA